MPTYLVERYLPGRDRARLDAALDRLRRQPTRAAYLGSTYVPEDDSCYCRFEAETADDVWDANEIARVPFARIVAAHEIGIRQPRPIEKARWAMKRIILVLVLPSGSPRPQASPGRTEWSST